MVKVEPVSAAGVAWISVVWPHVWDDFDAACRQGQNEPLWRNQSKAMPLEGALLGTDTYD